MNEISKLFIRKFLVKITFNKDEFITTEKCGNCFVDDGFYHNLQVRNAAKDLLSNLAKVV